MFRQLVTASVLAASIALVGNVPGAHATTAAPSTTLIDNQIINDIREWLGNPVVPLIIEAQNKKYSALSEADIDRLDKQWRQETKQDDQPLIANILSNPLSNYLTQIQAGSGGLYTEMFVMDANGLNVGQSGITSDFWQGDEAKFQKTFPKGHGAIFIDEAEYNEATASWRAQVNLTISDTNNRPIGAITVEYNLTELARRNDAN
ncbi:hypothetical protein [Sneathiella chinensis]|uniref:Uncharacterized protein n=1 Tax=Sneathiella chinensis TaxID=349750 RepID=A0ABQ5U3Q3_9PROT|nr:hypothetical protein [Sneathiella chinensis]GLQ06712.1 hypothetical protein GCM10007924_19330 [Sneathiella chinensis]